MTNSDARKRLAARNAAPDPKSAGRDDDPGRGGRVAHNMPEGVETSAGGGAPRQDTGTAWDNRSEDCPEAPAQVHPLDPAPDTTGLREAVEARVSEFNWAAAMEFPGDPHDPYRRMAYQNAAAALRADLAAHPDPAPEASHQLVRNGGPDALDTCTGCDWESWDTAPSFAAHADHEPDDCTCPPTTIGNPTPPDPHCPHVRRAEPHTGDVSDPAALTDAEREALEGAIADGRVSDSIIQHGPPKDHALLHRVLRAECARFVEHAAPTVERIVAARVAEAVGQERAARWDDGYRAAMTASIGLNGQTNASAQFPADWADHNPYRTLLDNTKATS